ncbi:hypothetical protein [Agrobacterium rubi]|uniref:DUF2946 domain-containing protein n=1 Tax=Agrobacterium rubi TaxID=28099 RepID=A0ABX2JER5_9HYPH|nr:hypothetical protein [Agrobacterium rubi]NTE89416.1 hypothetical protein [Agrobacterium rubi]NTF39552.1 hypothetical protein [Agrobacterium rubi]
MQQTRKIGRLMLAIMSLLMVLNLIAMSSASAHGHTVCPTMHSSDHSDRPHPDSPSTSVCCSVASCCPLLPTLMMPVVAPAPERTPYATVEVDTALLLVRAIDPPPRRGWT